MSIVFVLNKDKTPLDPTNTGNARRLLDKNKAVIHKYRPFVIRLKKQVIPNTQDYRLKIDYGSRYTGLAILKGKDVVWLGELHHRTNVKSRLMSRSQSRRSRRSRKLRYRQPRFDNRVRSVSKGWIPPTLESRVDNIENFVRKYRTYIPITQISYESTKFDAQKMKNPEIEGVEYQQGELQGYEVRQYLLEKYNHTCAYSGESGVPLEVEHIVPKSRGGSDRVSNLTIATREVNQDKGNLSLEEWEEKLKKRNNKRDKIILNNLPKIKESRTQGFQDVAIMNATRNKVLEKLKETGLPVETGSGGLTKYNRTKLELPKTHYYDACSIGKSTPSKLNFKTEEVLIIKAMGRGKRQMVIPDRHGFPRGYRENVKVRNGLMTGDFAKIEVPRGKGQGTHYSRLTVKKDGTITFLNNSGERLAKTYKYATKLQGNDGYDYIVEKREI